MMYGQSFNTYIGGYYDSDKLISLNSSPQT